MWLAFKNIETFYKAIAIKSIDLIRDRGIRISEHNQTHTWHIGIKCMT